MVEILSLLFVPLLGMGMEINMEIEKQRDSRFELLRIISICGIVLHHLVIHTSVLELPALSLNRNIAQLFDIGGKFGVNCFVLISGYFQVNSFFKSKKLWCLERQVLFYTIVPLVLFAIFAREYIDGMVILKTVFPVTFRTYWYISAYFGMYFFSPYLNFLLKKINREQHLLLIIIVMFMLSIAPTLFRQRHWCSEIGWFLLLYIIGAFIRLYGNLIGGETGFGHSYRSFQ